MENAKILLVDDDYEFVNRLRSTLQARDYTVKSAVSGVDALDILNKETFDVAIVDVRMPEMDGLTLLDEFKKIRPEMEAILLTGYASVQTGVDGMSKGAYDFLVKPIGIEALITRIESAFDKKKAHQDLEKEKQAEKFGDGS